MSINNNSGPRQPGTFQNLEDRSVRRNQEAEKEQLVREQESMLLEAKVKKGFLRGRRNQLCQMPLSLVN